MRLQGWLFLLIGFGIGFGGLYTWTKQRAPEVVRATPLNVDPNVPTDLSGGAGAGPGGEQPPAVDMARLQELKSRIQQNPRDFEALVEIGNSNFDMQQFEDAISMYKRALDLRPDATNVRTDMGTAMFYQKRFDDAIATFQEALKADPNNAQALFNLGVTMLHGKNDPKGAIQYWQRMIDANPNHPQAALVREQIQKLKEQEKQP